MFILSQQNGTYMYFITHIKIFVVTYAFEVHPCCCMYQNFFLQGIILHCMYTYMFKINSFVDTHLSSPFGYCELCCYGTLVYKYVFEFMLLILWGCIFWE